MKKSKAKPEPAPTRDFRWGIWRRIYACWQSGRRINAVSEGAALLFLHLHTAADDFGNLRGETFWVKATAAPARAGFSPKRIANMLDELAQTTPPLIRFYEIDGEKYLHIRNFISMQPAGRNGRRVMRFPREPSDFGESEDLESPEWGIQATSVQSAHAHTQKQTHEQIPLTPLERGKRLRPRERAKQERQTTAEELRHAERNARLAKWDRDKVEAVPAPKRPVAGDGPGTAA